MTTTLANSITHAPFGPVSGLTYGNGLTLTNTYDSQYRLTDTQVGQLLDRNYSFNGNDDITGINQEVTGQLVFDYDPLRRLEYAQTPSTILSWTYDSNGNRLSETAGQLVDTYYVDSWSNRLLEISGSTQSIYTYDANGNVLSKGGLNFSYDRYNSLTSVSGTVSATYTYNANRQRTSKTVNGQTTYYLYNQSGQLLAELDHSGQTKVEYVWLGTQPLAVIHSGPASAVVYYIHTDHLNTPQVVSDNQGTVVWRADYDAFGQASVAPGSILTFNLRFPGQYFDSETGLHYNYFRDYDPSTGRYIQSDPIGLQGGLNTYGYVENNPLIYSDPFGLLRWRGTATSVGVVGGVGATATRYELTSDWVDGKRATVTVIGVGPALGVGADVTTASSCVEFTEPFEFIKPELFNGQYVSDQVGWSMLWAGYGSGVTQLGEAWNVSHGKIDFGWDASWSLTVGSSTVVDVEWEER